MQFRPISPKDTAVQIAVLGVFLVLVLALLLASIAFRTSALGPVLAMILLLFCLCSVYALSVWSVRTTGYQCPSCRHRFGISLGTNLVSPHVWNKKLLRCPSCGQRGWANAVIKVRQPK